MRLNEDMNSKSINMLIPFSLRPIPQTREEHSLENDFSVLWFTLPLCSTFADAVQKV